MRGNNVNHIILNQKNDDTLVQNLVEKFREAFNRHDPQTIGSLLMEDGEWTDAIELLHHLKLVGNVCKVRISAR